MRSLHLVCMMALISPSLACTQEVKNESGSKTALSSAYLANFKAKKSEATELSAEDFGQTFALDFGYRLESDYQEYKEEEIDSISTTDCLENELLASTVISAVGHALKIVMDLKLSTTCQDELKAKAGEDLANDGFSGYLTLESLRYELNFVCENDVSDKNGASWTAPELETICAHSTGFSHHQVMKGEMTILAKSGSSVTEAKTAIAAESFAMNAEGGLCSRSYTNKTVSEESGCVQGYYTKNVSGTGMTTSYFLAVKSELKATIGPHPWYDSGTVEVDANNWHGSLIYAGGDRAPAYKMSNGAVNVEGSLDEPWALNAGRMAPQSPNVRFPAAPRLPRITRSSSVQMNK